MKALRFAGFLLKTGMGNIIHCAPTLVPILAVRVPALVFARSCHPYCSYRPYHPCLAALHPVRVILVSAVHADPALADLPAYDLELLGALGLDRLDWAAERLRLCHLSPVALVMALVAVAQ